MVECNNTLLTVTEKNFFTFYLLAERLESIDAKVIFPKVSPQVVIKRRPFFFFVNKEVKKSRQEKIINEAITQTGTE